MPFAPSIVAMKHRLRTNTALLLRSNKIITTTSNKKLLVRGAVRHLRLIRSGVEESPIIPLALDPGPINGWDTPLDWSGEKGETGAVSRCNGRGMRRGNVWHGRVVLVDVS